METSFNCSVLSNETLKSLNEFSVNIFKKDNEIFTDLGNNRYDIEKFKVDHLKDYICKVTNSDKHATRLWKVNVVDEVGIKEKLKDENEMKPRLLFSAYFQDELSGEAEFTVTNIHIISTTSTDVIDWTNIDSIYDWIKKLKRPNESQKPKFVTSFGAEFPLQGRGETLKKLIIGEGVKYGICKRFKSNKEKMYDKGRHPIPILANGPGTGKSRFLQELPTLLEHLDEYPGLFNEKDREYLRIFNDLKILSINITFNTKTGALSDLDASAGPASVALRILYEHFISGNELLSFTQFRNMCKNWKTLEISNALDVVIKDNGSTIDLVIIGIDELNRLHSLSKGDQKPVRDIVYAVGDLGCSERSILYVPILAGTIQGPLEHIITESTYKLLRLPLRLLSDEEMAKISSHMGDREELLKEYINQHYKTFQRCVSDLGGQVRAMELFYEFLLKEIDFNHTVDYVYVLKRVKSELTEGYPFKEVVTCMKHVVAFAILNIPVNKDCEIKNGVSYVNLSSKGIINLEELPYPNPDMLFYVRMPYMWVWILTSIKGFEAGKFWDVMINHDTHILWQAFEDFNVRFWILRLQLLKVLYEKITIQDLLRGAHHAVSCPLLDYEFQLPDVEEYYVELESRFPENVKIDFSFGTMYKNGKGAPCTDHFFFLNNLLVFIQDKSSDPTAGQPQSLSKSMIKNEHKKAEMGYERFKSSFKGKCPIKHWVLFICTNGSGTKGYLKSLPENCFVVDCSNFKAFYGYTFSSRAEFSAANDKLDANTAEEFELRTIRGIGPVIANEICRKRKERPFDNDIDLYNRVKKIPDESKIKIEVVKKYC